MEDFSREELFDILFDNRNNSDEILIKEVEAYFSRVKPFEHKSIRLADACGIKDVDSLSSYLETGAGKSISENAEYAENTYSKRELSVICASFKYKINKSLKEQK